MSAPITRAYSRATRQGETATRPPGCQHDAYDYLNEAMDSFEKAETLRPPNNDDAVLRWNTCARIIMGNGLTPRMQETVEIGGD